ncbi:hypothetical protein M405DRAFT_502566 [Rhizopogon salebrosus TDB-379]|nr:hypothetical protein M405DRAFT_502566 [Rhizopogon salebrosus TDB-379]
MRRTGTVGSTFIGGPIGFSFRPLSKIASLRFFNPSRCDRPDEGWQLCTPNSYYTAKTYTASTHNRSTGEIVELEHQRVTLLVRRLIRPFLEAHVVALVPRPGVQSQTMDLMGFQLGHALRCQANLREL